LNITTLIIDGWSINIGKYLVYVQLKVISEELKEQYYANIIKLTRFSNYTKALYEPIQVKPKFDLA
jgi:hypothetical protein